MIKDILKMYMKINLMYYISIKELNKIILKS